VTAIEGFGKAAEALVSVIRDACGIVIEPAKKKANARAEMVIEKEELRHKYELRKADIIESVKQRVWERELRRNLNIEQIGLEALDLLSEDADPQRLDRNWLDHFIASCQDVGEDEIRSLWAQILAQETAIPGRYSKRTLDYLKNFSVVDCRLFETFRSFVFRHEAFSVFVMPDEIRSDCLEWPEFFQRYGFAFEQLIHLVNIGVISAVNRIHLPVVDPGLSFTYFDWTMTIRNKPKTAFMLDEGLYMLSEVGDQLARVIEGKPNVPFLRAVKAALELVPFDVDLTKGGRVLLGHCLPK
jgi:hypothetical protein